MTNKKRELELEGIKERNVYVNASSYKVLGEGK